MAREEAIDCLEGLKIYLKTEHIDQEALDMAIEALQAEPVKHGEWVESKIPNELYVCSNCGGACWSYDYERTIVKSNFCPNCGAKMRGSKILGKEAECIIDEANAYRGEEMTREEAISVLKETIDPNVDKSFKEWKAWDKEKHLPAVNMAIEALQAEPVVRCKECIYYRPADVICEIFNDSTGLSKLVQPDDYCSNGERRD